MRKFLFFLAAAIAATTLTAAPVDQATAYKKAKSFLANNLKPGQMMSPDALNPVLIKAEMGVSLSQPVFYIYNTPNTYLVISGDDRAEEILVVGDRPLDLNRIPDGLKDMLNQYKEEIEYLQSHPGLKVKPIVSPENTPSLRATSVGPLLTSTWDQTAPYWNQCVFTYQDVSYQCYTGCPATSASQVLYYWRYPNYRVSAIPSYTRRLDISKTQVVYNYTYPALPATTFDWANMKDSYNGNYTDAQANAVATLMRYVGQAEKVMYGTQSAGGSGLYTSDQQNYINMFTLFGYEESTLRYVSKNSYSEADWAALIQAEMTAQRPILYDGQPNSNSDGHIFNVDGYRTSDNKYHCNFGWGGYGDAWCAMNSFGYAGEYYTYGQGAFIGIQPSFNSAPVLKANPNELTFDEAYLGDTNSKTFVVSGRNVTSRVYVNVSGSGFSVSPTSFTADEIATGEARVTVTYDSFEVGTHEGTVTLSTSGAENTIVSLTGTTLAKPVLRATPTALNFTTTLGTQAQKTLYVRGTNLNGNVTLALEGTGFSLDMTTISKSAATSGKTVLVTYNPTEAGSFTGNIIIRSVGADDLIVPITAIVNDDQPRIFANPASLSFNAVTGESVSQNFTVTGANITGNLTLTLNDESGAYSINRTSVSASQAASGQSIKVTYAPTTYGNHDATVTISGGGASDVTVNLSGVASLTKFGPVMLEPNDIYVALNRFRAEWTDETPEMNVASYTLEVNAVPTTPECVGVGNADFSSLSAVTNSSGSYTNQVNNASNYLPAGWSATSYLYIDNGAVISRAYGSTYGTIVSPNYDFTGYDKVSVVVNLKRFNADSYSEAIVRVASSMGSENITCSNTSDYTTYTVVLDVAQSDHITLTALQSCYALHNITIYAGDITQNRGMLKASESGDLNYRLITEIDPANKFFTVKNLADGGTFIYRVKALYIDGTESDWSNEQEVTLHENEHPYTIGDVNHDEAVDVNDVTMVIAYILGAENGVCPVCANVNGDDAIDVSDVTLIISIILGGDSSNKAVKPANYYILLD